MIELTKKKLPLPEHIEGTQKNIQESIVFRDREAAKTHYIEAKKRLLDINNWCGLCMDAGATFEMTDEQGMPGAIQLQKGFYIKIDIPGPGAASGRGFDWVQVEAVIENADAVSDTEYTIIRVRPASDPTTSNENTAHFFTGKATSNFLVLREGLEITAAVLGRNEVTNTHEDNSFFDKIRNMIVSTAAKTGMADGQWNKLVAGILGKINAV